MDLRKIYPHIHDCFFTCWSPTGCLAGLLAGLDPKSLMGYGQTLGSLVTLFLYCSVHVHRLWQAAVDGRLASKDLFVVNVGVLQASGNTICWRLLFGLRDGRIRLNQMDLCGIRILFVALCIL